MVPKVNKFEKKKFSGAYEVSKFTHKNVSSAFDHVGFIIEWQF